MKWFRSWFTPDEQKVLLFLATVLLAGAVLHTLGVYRQRTAPQADRLTQVLALDTPLLYDLRTVTQEELETLPGIGPATAGAIVAWRAEHRFNRREDLQQVEGIGPQTYRRIAEYFVPITVADTLVPPVSFEEPVWPLNLNTATETQLEALPGIGPRKATDILALRTRLGRFTAVDDLLQVPGIGEKTLEKMREYITVGDKP